MNKTILITGIHGFVGGNIVTALKNQHTLYGLDIVSPQKEGIRLSPTDLVGARL